MVRDEWSCILSFGWCKQEEIFLLTSPMGMGQSVPKPRPIKFRLRGITPKKENRTFRTHKKFEITNEWRC